MTSWRLDEATPESASIGNGPSVPSLITGTLGTEPSTVGAPAAVTVPDEVRAESGLDIALCAADRIHRSLLVAAELIREQREAEANRQFMRCLEGLERFIETVRFVRLTMRLDFEQIRVDGRTLGRIDRDLAQILQTISNNLALSDWEAVADRIEYELITNLVSWKSALKGLQPVR